MNKLSTIKRGVSAFFTGKSTTNPHPIKRPVVPDSIDVTGKGLKQKRTHPQDWAVIRLSMVAIILGIMVTVAIVMYWH